MTSCIVTCIYDLKSRSPEYFHRSGEEYACMLEYHRRFGVPVYCYTEEHLKDKLPDFVIPIVLDFDLLYAKSLIRESGKGYNNVMVGNQVHDGHRLYSIVTNSKIFMISNLEPMYDTIIWLDSGIEHVDPAPEHIALETYNNMVQSDKSYVNLINYPTYIQLDNNMYNVASGMFSIKRKDIPILIQSYKEILDQCYNDGYICLEEQVFTLLYLKHKDIFDVSFTDYRVLTNGKYYRMDYAVIMRNLYVVPKHISDIITNVFLESLSTGNAKLPSNELMDYLILIYNTKQDLRVCRIFKHLLLYKDYTNNPNYKSRYNVVQKLCQSNIMLNHLQHIEQHDSMYSYLREYPLERSIISTLM